MPCRAPIPEHASLHPCVYQGPGRGVAGRPSARAVTGDKHASPARSTWACSTWQVRQALHGVLYKDKLPEAVPLRWHPTCALSLPGCILIHVCAGLHPYIVEPLALSRAQFKEAAGSSVIVQHHCSKRQLLATCLKHTGVQTKGAAQVLEEPGRADSPVCASLHPCAARPGPDGADCDSACFL